ncbi:anthrone oxygenase family protein [Actinopolymorpha singaporensis]
MPEIILVVSRVLAGLLAGVYLAFLLAVMPALHSQPDDVFIKVMNRINVVIVNPIFVVLFLGAPIVTAVLVRWHRDAVTVLAIVTAVLAVVITVVANIPLNHALANGGSRTAFEKPWIAWHVVRTLLTCASFGLLALPRATAG